MITLVLLMFVAGIGLTQAVSDPRQVTLSWLRLGGLIAAALLALVIVGAVAGWAPLGEPGEPITVVLGMAVLMHFIQLMLVQLGRETPQRWAALGAFILSGFVVFSMLGIATPLNHGEPLSRGQAAGLLATAYCSSGLLGGLLMTMLLGHAYLTAAGRMTQAPFLRLVVMLAVLLLLRSISSVIFGIIPYVDGPHDPSMTRTWNVMMITLRCLVGLATPGVFTYMIWDCVRRRANQSATGILYVTLVVVIVGEGAALMLIKATGLMF